MSNNFTLIGAAGYIAQKHLKAIKETGNNLIAAFDPHDSVGILDSYFPEASFFTEFERFDRHAEKLKRLNDSKKIDYVSICSPNYLHDAHIRFALRIGANAICEKPVVLNPWNIDALMKLEKEFHKKVFTILQLRLHPTIRQLKQTIDKEKNRNKYKVDLTYITSRGSWYQSSWKGDVNKSGGLATNIGVHFFDMLIWIFGKVQDYQLYENDDNKMTGTISLEKADIKWLLSINNNDLPENIRKQGKRTFRKISIDGKEIEFSDGFTDLHTELYKQILKGKGFSLKDAKPSIELVSKLRDMKK